MGRCCKRQETRWLHTGSFHLISGFSEGLVIVSIFNQSSGHCHANDFEPTPTLVQPASNSKLGSSLWSVWHGDIAKYTALHSVCAQWQKLSPPRGHKHPSRLCRAPLWPWLSTPSKPASTVPASGRGFCAYFVPFWLQLGRFNFLQQKQAILLPKIDLASTLLRPRQAVQRES